MFTEAAVAVIAFRAAAEKAAQEKEKSRQKEEQHQRNQEARAEVLERSAEFEQQKREQNRREAEGFVQEAIDAYMSNSDSLLPLTEIRKALAPYLQVEMYRYSGSQFSEKVGRHIPFNTIGYADHQWSQVSHRLTLASLHLDGQQRELESARERKRECEMKLEDLKRQLALQKSLLETKQATLNNKVRTLLSTMGVVSEKPLIEAQRMKVLQAEIEGVGAEIEDLQSKISTTESTLPNTEALNGIENELLAYKEAEDAFTQIWLWIGKIATVKPEVAKHIVGRENTSIETVLSNIEKLVSELESNEKRDG